MKLKPLIFALLCFGGNCINWAQDTQPPNVEELYDFLLTDLGVLREFPDDPFVLVLFFDIDHDGIPDALATYKGNDYTGTGGGGYLWHFYRFKDGKWQTGPLQEIEDGVFDPNIVYSARDGFFSLTREGQKPILVASYPFSGKIDDRLELSLYASEITIDGEGYLRDTPIPELTIDVVAPWDDEKHTYVFPDFPPEYNSLRNQLVPVSVTTLRPREKPEDDKSPPVATAEQEGGEQISPSRDGEEKLEIRNEELGVEKEKANRLWLYAALALLLSAVFYFVRRTKP